jgi:hypothetical protein
MPRPPRARGNPRAVLVLSFPLAAMKKLKLDIDALAVECFDAESWQERSRAPSP